MVNRSFANIIGLEHYYSEKLGIDIRLACSSGKKIHLDPDDNIQSQTGRSLLGQLMRHCNRGGVFRARRFSFPQQAFSISHSFNTVVCAYKQDDGVNGLGIDIELNRHLSSVAGRLFLSRREQRLLSMRSAYSSADLLRLWTVKEALFKADMNNSKRGWLSLYECINPAAWSGNARLRLPGTNLRFRFASARYQSGFLSVAVCN